ncbi:MAG: xylan 1,4-beta-xylosidase [Oscillospiraceae bacterium]|nr:xylan 1,4-beta-xylosidase [Oscillospiraceae bacterium]
MADEKRFIKTHSQGFWSRTMEIWVDKKTGVNYLVTNAGYAGGMTVLVDAQGKPIITPIREYDE